MNNEENFKDLSIDKCFFITERKRHARIDELMLRKGLTRGVPHLLFALKDNDGCTQKELAEMLIIRPASVTTALQNLEASGHIKREADKADLRVMRVFLSEKGADTLEECIKVFDQMEQECYGNFSDEERLEIKRLLSKIVDNLSLL